MNKIVQKTDHINVPSIKITPRFAGAPKGKGLATSMDFLIDIVMPEKLTSDGSHRRLNVCIGIDLSSSMNDHADEFNIQSATGKWLSNPIKPSTPSVNAPNGGILMSPLPIPAQFPPYGPPNMPTIPNMPTSPWQWEVPSDIKRATKLDRTKEAALCAIDMLSEQDRLAMVGFSDGARIIFPSDYATPANKEKWVSAIVNLRASGCTALHAGWKAAVEQVSSNVSPDSVNRILLLTDGEANVGIQDMPTLCEHVSALVSHYVTTSTFGVGQSFSEDLLQAMAEAGDGRYYYLDREPMAVRFKEEFSGMSQMLGRNLRLSVQGGEGILANSCLNNFKIDKKGYILPNAVRGATLQAVVRGTLSGDNLSGWSLTGKLSWTDMRNVTQITTCEFTLPPVSKKQFDAMKEDPRVGERVADLEIATAKKAAIAAMDKGDFLRSQTILAGATASASASIYDNVQLESVRLSALSTMASAGDHVRLRKSASYDVYETSNSRNLAPTVALTSSPPSALRPPLKR